jgi:hypothetical protein
MPSNDLRTPFRLPAQVSGFHEYFKFKADTETVLAQLGYGFSRDVLVLPQAPHLIGEWAVHLRSRLNAVLRRISLEAEATRREFLVAPILLEVSLAVDARLRSEFPVSVSKQLHGSLDYLLQRENSLVVVEAKQADMAKGFTQLSAELVAVDSFAAEEIPILYGALTVGDTWRFAVLHRPEKRVVQDLRQYNVPDNLDDLLATLLGILQGA